MFKPRLLKQDSRALLRCFSDEHPPSFLGGTIFTEESIWLTTTQQNAVSILHTNFSFTASLRRSGEVGRGTGLGDDELIDNDIL